MRYLIERNVTLNAAATNELGDDSNELIGSAATNRILSTLHCTVTFPVSKAASSIALPRLLDDRVLIRLATYTTNHDPCLLELEKRKGQAITRPLLKESTTRGRGHRPPPTVLSILILVVLTCHVVHIHGLLVFRIEAEMEALAPRSTKN